MKIDLTKELTTPYGHPMKISEDANSGYLTLAKALVIALDYSDSKEQTSSDEKYQRFKILSKVVINGEDAESADFTVEELVLIKSAVGKVFSSAFTMGQIWSYLEGN
jgi:hypothetical protein